MSTPTNTFPHLHPDVVALLDKPVATRIEHTKADRWIGYPYAKQLREQLDDHLSYAGVERPPCALIIGPSNIGKSAFAKNYAKQCHPPHPDGAMGIRAVPVLFIPIIAPPTPSELYAKIIEELGFSFNPEATLKSLKSQAHALIKTVGLKALVIDEMNSITSTTPAAQKSILLALRYLNVTYKICIFGLTAPEGANLTLHDTSLTSRFDRFEIPQWDNNEAWRVFLARLESQIPLPEASKLSATSFAELLHDKTEGILGEAVKLVTKMAVHALHCNMSKMPPELVSEVGWIEPRKRRSTIVQIVPKPKKTTSARSPTPEAL